VRQEKSAFEELTKTLSQVHLSSTVKLNVGGKIYKTTLDTLRKDPDSMLCAMFSGRHELKPDEEDGAYFIDRDAELFRYILNYLRSGELRCPNDKILQEDLLAEAKFYQVKGIIAQLEVENFPTSLLILSVIIKDEQHCSAVRSWLPPGATCSLLYRATTDGKSLQAFHRCCDNKGPTLLVVKSGHYICGGYTSKSWQSHEEYTATVDIEAFLYSLVNPSGSEPTKINRKPGASGGTRCWKDSGPRFSSKNSNDFAVNLNDPNVFAGYLNLGNGFFRPQNAHLNNFFTGISPFQVTELEVFKVDV